MFLNKAYRLTVDLQCGSEDAFKGCIDVGKARIGRQDVCVVDKRASNVANALVFPIYFFGGEDSTGFVEGPI